MVKIKLFNSSMRKFYMNMLRSLTILPPINGNAVASIVFRLPRYSIHGPPAMPPKSALSGMSEPIHMPCNIKKFEV